VKRFTITKDNRDEVIPRIGSYLRALNCEKPQYVKIDEKKETRRIGANNLYWKWVGVISQELGYNPAEMHIALVTEILGYDILEIMGRTITKPKETHTLSVADFSSYMEAVSRFAAEHGIRLPAEEI